MDNLTQNINLLSTVSFKLIINSYEFKNTEFFTVSANLPGVTLNEATASFRNQKGYVPGETLQFDTLNIRLAIDEDFRGYSEIFNWMKSHTNKTDLKRADIILCVMTSHNNINKRFLFKNAFPTSLGPIEFNAQASEVEYAYTDIVFRYDSFEFDNKLFCP